MDHDAMSSSVQNLALVHLQYNSIVVREAAMAFYRMNSFAFDGDHGWRPVVKWLEAIGAPNRSDLANLKVSAPSPMRLVQDENGNRTAVDLSKAYEDIYQCHPSLGLPTTEPLAGTVENVNTIVERIFEY